MEHADNSNTFEQVNKKTAEYAQKGASTPYTSVLLRMLLVALVICSLFVFFAGLMQYKSLTDQKEKLQAEIKDTKGEIEELEYLIDAPVDYDYIVRIAKEKLNLYFPDEVIYYNDHKK